MAFAHLQDHASTTTSAAPTCAFGSNVTAGSLLLMLFTTQNAFLPSSVTDTLGTTYVAEDADIGGVVLFTGIAPSGGANTVTAHLPNTEAGTVAVAEFSGGSSPVPDVSPASTTGTSTAVLSHNATGVSVPNELFVSFFTVGGTTTSSISAPSGGFTAMATGTLTGAGWAYLIGTGTTAHQCGWTIAPSRTWTAYIDTFKPAVFTPTNTMRSFVPQMRASNWMERAKGLLVPERERLILPRLALAR